MHSNTQVCGLMISLTLPNVAWRTEQVRKAKLKGEAAIWSLLYVDVFKWASLQFAAWTGFMRHLGLLL